MSYPQLKKTLPLIKLETAMKLIQQLFALIFPAKKEKAVLPVRVRSAKRHFPFK